MKLTTSLNISVVVTKRLKNRHCNDKNSNYARTTEEVQDSGGWPGDVGKKALPIIH